MGRRTLKNQLQHVVCESKKLGCSKRADRLNGVDCEKYLYSHNSTKKMFALVNTFSEWFKIYHPEIKWVRDIKPKHWQEFVDSNSKNWTSATCREYQSRIHKLGKMVSEVFSIEADYTAVKIQFPGKQKQNRPAMDPDDFRLLNQRIIASKSYSRFLPSIAAKIGSRNEETRSIQPEDIDLEKKIVHLRNCKNGKKRNVRIRSKDFKFFKFLKNYMIQQNWKDACNGTSENSCNQYIRKCMKEVGISDKYHQSIHSIRKMYAIERMQEEMKNGNSWRTSWIVVQQELGHGSRFRGELARAYLQEN